MDEEEDEEDEEEEEDEEAGSWPALFRASAAATDPRDDCSIPRRSAASSPLASNWGLLSTSARMTSCSDVFVRSATSMPCTTPRGSWWGGRGGGMKVREGGGWWGKVREDKKQAREGELSTF